MNNYVTLEEEYRHKFFQVPKVFFTNDKYINMSNNAKIAWSLLRDRSSLSRKNKWFDLIDGKRVVYFIFTNEELMKLLNIKSKTTLSNVKKELESANLIESRRRGVNKPNKMYLINPDITEEDIYAIDEFDEYEYKEYKAKKKAINHEGQGGTEIGRPKNEHPDVQKMYTNNTDPSYTDLNNLDTKDTTKDSAQNFNSFFSMTEQQKQQKKEEYISRAFYENTEYIPEKIAEMLSVFSRTTDEAKKYYDIILIAKKKVEEETGEMIWLEDDPDLVKKIINSFSRAIRKIEKRQVKINNPRGYLYNSIYSVVSMETSARIRVINTDKPYFNWVEDIE